MENPKLETLNSKQTQIIKAQNSKRYDLGERTLSFSRRVFSYVKELPKITTNDVIGRQLIRAGGSVGANYLEAEESLSRKDFLMRIKISRKEAKESRYWLILIEPQDCRIKDKDGLVDEATQLMKIFGSIIEKSK